jgi:hypothetical protein
VPVRRSQCGHLRLSGPGWQFDGASRRVQSYLLSGNAPGRDQLMTTNIWR